MSAIDAFRHEPRIAYFSMEIALRNDIPTYAGGLGVLAGDTLRSAADLEVPLVAVTLVSTAGYFRQTLDDQGRQTEQPSAWEPALWAERLEAMVAVTIEGRGVWVGGWCYVVKGHMGGAQPVILLDTDIEQNSDEDRRITQTLYGGDNAYRLRQEIVLGIGGVRMLQALGFEVREYHMNEGHSALLGVELLRRYARPAEDLRPGESPYDIPRVRELCCFTTHTPVEAGHDRFSYDLVQRTLGDVIDLTTLKRLAGDDHLNMTRLALNLSEYINGVAKRHAEVSRHMFPGYRVHAVTNGVHPFTWTSASFRRLYDAKFPGWCHEPELLVRADCCMADTAIWEAHVEAKRALVDAVKERTGIMLQPDHLTIGFGRRMTAYKRPDLLFSDLGRLKNLAARHPIQLVVAGKAHPRDEPGKRLIETLHAHVKELAGVVTMAYLPGYDMDTALTMVAGVDVWLNTPLRPHEASGTSGMKAAFNGVPQLSVLDGWWVEGCIEGVTGWAIGDDIDAADGDAAALYQKLEQVVVPLYYQDRAGWIAVMKGTIAKSASFFNSHRMMRRYASETYVR
ncbi:MAG: starch phosphorylase [Gammaproteobacteria bacterium]|nr:MAG: starch phosphorylase [Gammaproteobacteria bacterium]TND04367.1 MAG: starch phosphorylase [Gammaproteobacteria bacterium]